MVFTNSNFGLLAGDNIFGPAKIHLDRNSGSPIVLGVTDGDCVVNISEDEHVVVRGSTGRTRRGTYGLGINAEFRAPFKAMTIAQMVEMYGASAGGASAATTEDPDGTGSLTATTKLKRVANGPYKKTTYDFEAFPEQDDPTDGRSADKDYDCFRMPTATIRVEGDETLAMEGMDAAAVTVIARGEVSAAAGLLFERFNVDLDDA